MNNRLNLALFFGGQSPEHEVSIRSARNIARAVNQKKYKLHLIGVDKQGKWFLVSEADFFSDDLTISNGRQLALIPGQSKKAIILLESMSPLVLEVIFPIIHGPNGEDGTMQGIFRQLGIPFVGPDVTASAVAMDKDVCKRLLAEAGLLVADSLVFMQQDQGIIDYTAVSKRLGKPVFIKPANMGSSVGVSRADTIETFEAAIKEAFRYDKKIIIEEMIEGREVECAIVGNEVAEASGIGEVVKNEIFYDYESKYLSNTGADVVIPAEIDKKTTQKLRDVARKAYQIIGCEGMARVDMFLTDDDRVYINELNTLPGFTSISMYPKLWETEGLSYPDLIDRLVELALDKGQKEAALEKSLS